jgi:molybdopterin molybdotransferase
VISLAEARQVVLRGLSPLPPRTVPLAAAAGCVLAEPVVAAQSLPRFA